jgi:uncharacterized membrane protein (UPF0182 family)
MNRLLRLSLSVYERLLMAYPADLRRDFGPDMLEAFADDLRTARGIGGFLCVWLTTLREVLAIAVPAWLEIPTVAVPLLSAAIVAASQSPLVVMAARRQLLTPYPILADALLGVGIGSAISALTSFVAIYRWKRAGFTTLRIG